MGDNAVFCFSTKAGDCSLTLGRPQDQVVSQVDVEARSRTTRVKATSLIRVRVRGERGSWCSMEVKTEAERALHILQNVLDERKMGFTRSMHVKTHLLNDVGDVKTRQSQVLKCTSKTPILRRVLDWIASRSEQLSLSVRGSHG